MTGLDQVHATIAQLARLAHTDFQTVQMLTALCGAARSSLDVDGVGVMSSDGVRTRFVDTDLPELLALERLQETLQQGPCRESIDTAAAVVVEDLQAFDVRRRWPEFGAAARTSGVGSVLAVPLLARERAWGTLDLYRRRTGPWSHTDLQAASLLADVAASYLVLAHDRDAAETTRRQLAARSLHDELTGLPNRSLFMDRLEQALHAARRHPGAVAVLFIDLDRFKEINDTFGHAAGDLVLAEVARRMNAVTRDDDTLARLAGDEFVMVCVDLPSAEGGVLDNVLAGVTNRLRSALGAPVRIDGVDLLVSASIGVAVTTNFDADQRSVVELMRDADHAMYAAKAAGRGQVHLGTADWQAQSPGPDLARDLVHALEAGQFRVHYQPIVDTTSDRVHAVEALLRWEHPVLGLLPAVDFLELAVRGGHLPRMGHWVVGQACRDFAQWRREFPTRAPDVVFCNLSAVELADPQLGTVIATELAAAGLNPSDLGLEIVEDDLGGPALSPVLQALQTAGHPLSIDDFGTGYSSLSRLVTFPVTIAKIDKAFTSGLPDDARCRSLVDAVLVVAHSLGLRVIAEGVETVEQASHLRDAGCEFLQGYHTAVPVDGAGIVDLLRSSPSREAAEAGEARRPAPTVVDLGSGVRQC